MALRVRFQGPLTIIDEDLDLNVTVRIKNAALDTLTLSGTPMQLGAGTYTPLGLCEEIGEQLALWLRARLLAGAGVTGVPASADSFDLRVEWLPSEGVNQTLARWFLGSLSTTQLNAQQAQVDYIQVENTNDWGALLGLIEAGASSDRQVVSTLNGSTWEAEMLGLWQPWASFTFKRSEQDTGDYPIFWDVFTHELRDGTVTQSFLGSPSFWRELTLVDQKSSISGPMYIIGEFDSIALDRKSIDLRVAKPQAQGMAGAGFYSSRIVAGRYVLIGHADPWLARIKSFNAASGQLDFYNKVPSNLATPEDMSPVMGVSEAMALYILSLQRGGHAVYEADAETGEALFYGGLYSVRASGQITMRPDRRDNQTALWSLPFSLVRHGAPGVVKP